MEIRRLVGATTLRSRSTGTGVLVSEDFFVAAPAGPAAAANPNYHRAADTTIDPAYAVDLIRVVAAAAWVSAST